MSDAAPLASADVTDADAASVAIADLHAGPRDEAVTRNDRRFYVGLALAFTLHSLLFAGFYSSPPRNIGDPSGSPDAINVALITDAELRSLSSVPDSQPKGPPAPPAPPPEPTTEAAPAPATTPPQPPAEAAPAPEPPSSPTPPAVQAPLPTPAPAPETAVADDALSLKPMEDLVAPPQRKSEAKPTEPPKQEPPPRNQPPRPERQKTANLDLSPPPMFSAPTGGGGAGIQRPPGITRSGENDAFARAVVSALQRSMPQLMDTRGRVTVRITLDMDGGVVSTQVVRPSNVAGLDRSVVFATKQTSYPFPPRKAKPDDLVFLITYIYN